MQQLRLSIYRRLGQWRSQSLVNSCLRNSRPIATTNTPTAPSPTPLALLLAAQIKVPPSQLTFSNNPGKRTDSSSRVHNAMSNSSQIWILHHLSRSIRTKRRFCHISRNIANVWRNCRDMDSHGMDRVGQTY